MIMMMLIGLALVSVGATLRNGGVVVIAGDHWPRARENLDDDDNTDKYDNTDSDDNDDNTDCDDNDDNDCDEDGGTSCPLSLSRACIAPPMKPKFVPPWNLHNI